MILAELTRNNAYVSGMTPYSPFVWVGHTSFYTLRDAWETDVDDLFTYDKRIKVVQVVQDYLEKYEEQETLNDCIAQAGSFYFDRANQRVYVHMNHDANPIHSHLDYGYSFGMTNHDVIYIDDYEYLPLIASYPGSEVSADAVGQDKPTGVSGSLVLDNRATRNELTGLPVGLLDDLITESVYGNDVILYDYVDGVATPCGAFMVEDLTISQTDITLNLQDKRYTA